MEISLKNWDTLRKCAKFLISVFYPPICLGCERMVSAYGTLCPDCWQDLRFITKPYCPVMGIPFSHDMGDGFLSGEALQIAPSFTRARSAVVYRGVARILMIQLKYCDRTELAHFIANWMIFAGREVIHDCDVIIPIPLHFRRFFWRRYNQAAELARCIAKMQKKPFKPGWLVRCRHTRSQVGLSTRERQRNLRRAFEVPNGMKKYVEGCSILLVDDVFTTGVTAMTAATTLKRAGARQVDVLTFVRVLKDDLGV